MARKRVIKKKEAMKAAIEKAISTSYFVIFILQNTAEYQSLTSYSAAFLFPSIFY